VESDIERLKQNCIEKGLIDESGQQIIRVTDEEVMENGVMEDLSEQGE
jgi:hypothetical protein